jgi:tetratricopeptide (TPR) repeat protein
MFMSQEPDYSKDSDIDSRIKQVCANAEADFIINQSVTKKPKIPFRQNFESNNEQNYSNYNNNYNSQNNFNQSLQNTNMINTNNMNQMNNNNFNNNNIKIIDETYKLNPQNILQSQQEQKTIKVKGSINNFQSNQNINNQTNPNFINSQYQNINNQSNPNFIYSQNQNFQNQTLNNLNTLNTNNTQNNPDLNKQPLNISRYNNPNNNINPINKYNTRKYKPIINQNNKKIIIEPLHQNHISSKSNIDINKLLLNSKTLIKKYKFKTAYNNLKSAINLGIYHSDLFYLYGEVNRILKNFQEAEDYLLLALNFELHSPYVFYSLGLLYQEISQFKYSNIFFKLFNQLLENPDVHFQMAKNYSQIGKFIKAVEQLTKAIELNKECPDYYKFRSEIYNLIGMKEMANEDEKMCSYIINSIRDEES